MKKGKTSTWGFVFQKYGKFWGISPGHFTKHKPLISEEWSLGILYLTCNPSYLDAKISDAESKLQLLNSSFEQFQTLTNDNQATSQQKIEEVESQIKSFKSHSEGTVQDVMGDTENLKVKILMFQKFQIFFLYIYISAWTQCQHA